MCCYGDQLEFFIFCGICGRQGHAGARGALKISVCEKVFEKGGEKWRWEGGCRGAPFEEC